jgi:hypothetical protein
MNRKWTLLVLMLGVSAWSCGDDATTPASNVEFPDSSVGDLGSFPDNGGVTPDPDTGPGTTKDNGGGTGEDGTDTTTVGDAGDAGDEDAGPLPGEFLYPCTSNNQCLSGFCVHSEQGQVCTKQCLEDCPAGWACSPIQQTGGDLVYVCLSRFVDLCRPCDVDDDCNSEFGVGTNACIDFQGDGSFCGVACTADTDCADGYTCQDVQLASGALSKQCVPAEGECACTETYIKQQARTDCYRENTFGKCTGERLCGPEGLTDCSAGAPAKEVCNGKDDNCDGIVDPPKADGCIDWYVDVDADGYGIGTPQCTCEAPGPGYVDKGGDCNDSNLSVNPDAVETCNGIDDNCDNAIDEAGSKGCSIYYPDADDDGFGSDTETVCTCSLGPGVLTTKGDCDDSNPGVYPGAEDICDAVDNDCDGTVDEENAGECIPYYFDQDQDGFGLAEKVKCLCGPLDNYTTTDAGDCNDNDAKVAPFKPEICDGVDNDCDGKIDEGEPVEMCGTAKNGTPACKAGLCVVDTCNPGYYDINFEIDDGCECKANAIESSGATCEKGVDVGNLADKGGAGSTVSVQGNAVYENESDWYVFKGSDGADAGGCDTYHVRVRFLYNPLNAYTFDIYRGSCASANQVCKQSQDFEWYTDFSEGEKGECPCVTDPDTTTETAHVCSDNTSLYYVRVYRLPEIAPSCEGYNLEITNGVY